MDITKLIKTRVKENKVILGYRTVIKSIKTSRPELIVFSNNIPEEKRRMIEHNAKIDNTRTMHNFTHLKYHKIEERQPTKQLYTDKAPMRFQRVIQE